MDHTKNGVSLERILLTLIIAIGFLGLTYAFQNKRAPSKENALKAPVSIQGTFTENTPIRFTLNLAQFPTKDLEIDFGNGTVRPLRGRSFAFAYEQAGKYMLKIKQNNQVLYHTSIYITKSGSDSADLIVMN